MNRHQTLAVALVAAAGGFVAGRAAVPASARAADGAPVPGSAGGSEGARTMVGFQLVPASGPQQKDLLVRGWDTGD
jgi:hypothetical protein